MRMTDCWPSVRKILFQDPRGCLALLLAIFLGALGMYYAVHVGWFSP